MPADLDVRMRTRAIDAWEAAAGRRDDSALGFLTLAADRTISALELEPGMHVLDVASGTGTAAILAGRAVAPDGGVIGVDLAESMLDIARDKATRAGLDDLVRFRRADMTATGLPDASFDAVTCVFGLVLVPDMPALARELWRMVKPGGQLAITTWGPRLWAPMTEVFKTAVAAERPDLVPPSDPWHPRERHLGHALVRPLAAAHAPRLVVDRHGHGAALDGRPADGSGGHARPGGDPRARASPARRLDRLQRALRPGDQARRLSDLRRRPAPGR
jgi:SAM-dependent methyltransferase